MPLLMEAARYKRVAEEWRLRAEAAADAAQRQDCEAIAGQYEELAELALSLRPPSRYFIAAYVRERGKMPPPAMRVMRLKKRPDASLAGSGVAEAEGDVRAG